MYSTLEVNPRESDLGKQVVQNDGKQELVNSGEIEPVAKEKSYAKEAVDDRTRTSQHLRRREIALILVFASMVILAAVLGGVLGSRKTHIVPETNIPSNRNIAALSFASGSINNTRVYFQNEKGQIMEAANSADNETWSVKDLGFGTKNASALAAAVSRPGFPFEISVFYLDENDLILDYIYNSSTGEWRSGILSNQNYKAMPNSSLTAMYNQCKFCANTTLIAFQDMLGFVQIGNLTSAGWTLSQLPPMYDWAPVTGLALLPNYAKGLQDEICLFFQNSALIMEMAKWTSAVNYDGNNGWSVDGNAYGTIPQGSSIAAAASYSQVSSGNETWLELLSISNRGIQVSTYAGATTHWLQNGVNPSIMANSTLNPRIYRSVAVTAIGKAFAAVEDPAQPDSIEEWQVEDDLVNWRSVGKVDLGGLWGMNDVWGKVTTY